MVSLPAVTDAGGAVTGGGDADGVLDLIGVQPEHAAGRDRRGDRGQGGVVPADLANAREGDLAQALLELVGQRGTEDQIAARASGPFGGCHGRRDDVGGVGRVLLPVDVVVVHDPDHEGVEQRRRDRVPALAGDQHRGVPGAGDFGQHGACDGHVVLLCTAQRTPDRVHQVTFGFGHHGVGKVVVPGAGGPLGHDSRHVGHFEVPPRWVSWRSSPGDCSVSHPPTQPVGSWPFAVGSSPDHPPAHCELRIANYEFWASEFVCSESLDDLGRRQFAIRNSQSGVRPSSQDVTNS